MKIRDIFQKHYKIKPTPDFQINSGVINVANHVKIGISWLLFGDWLF